jgi:multiple antibiotic resistance protein
MVELFFLTFIPLFVAMDAVGVLPVFLSFTEGFDRKTRTRVIIQSLITALIIAVLFLFLGELIFRFLGITVGDFMIAGGAVLFFIAVSEIVTQRKRQRMPGRDFASVPLGTPLIAGPAVLTTTLLLSQEHGSWITLVSLAANIAITGLVFFLSGIIFRIIGDTGARAMSKVTSLLLAAIAVMMVRKGVFLVIGAIH